MSVQAGTKYAYCIKSTEFYIYFLGTRKVTQTVTEEIKILTKLYSNSTNSKEIYVTMIIFRWMNNRLTQPCRMIRITRLDTALQATNAITRIEMMSTIFNENVSHLDNQPEFITASAPPTRILPLLFLFVLTICIKYLLVGTI